MKFKLSVYDTNRNHHGTIEARDYNHAKQVARVANYPVSYIWSIEPDTDTDFGRILRATLPEGHKLI